jgi:hypothetical protein
MALNQLGGLQCTVCLTAPDPTSLRGRLEATTRPAIFYGPWALSIKKSLAGLSVQLGSHVPNAHTHISKVSNIRVIMGLQDVWAGSVINDCKTCGHAAQLTTCLAPLQC